MWNWLKHFNHKKVCWEEVLVERETKITFPDWDPHLPKIETERFTAKVFVCLCGRDRKMYVLKENV